MNCRSVASTLNASGAKLWHSANGISSSTLSGQFMEVFLEEADLIRPERVVYFALHEQDEDPTIQHPPEILGFSQCLCPTRAHLVITLLEALLSKVDEGETAPYREHVVEEVCTLYLSLLPT
jgi:hypothetical protein